jgi:TrmH family RNA methyltransferase
MSANMTNVGTNVRALKVVRARRLLESKFRASQQAFLAEGPQAVREAIASGLVRELFITVESAERYTDIVSAAENSDIEINYVIADVIEVLASAVTPQGMVSVVNNPNAVLDSFLNPASKLVVALASVRDPGNAGSVIRVADAVAADGSALNWASRMPDRALGVKATNWVPLIKPNRVSFKALA